MRSVLRSALACVLLLAAGSARAATIDLTGAIGSAIAAGNADTVVYSGSSAFGDVTFSADPTGSDLTYQAGNGLGIDCRGGEVACLLDNYSQVDTGEVLSISFERPLFVTSVDIRNLFGTSLGIGRYRVQIEEGGSVVGSSFAIDFSSEDASAAGGLNLSVNRWASSIRFVPDGGFFDAFSVAGITIDELASALPAPSTSPIPEPSSVLMMLIGGALVVSQVRKRG